MRMLHDCSNTFIPEHNGSVWEDRQEATDTTSHNGSKARRLKGRTP